MAASEARDALADIRRKRAEAKEADAKASPGTAKKTTARKTPVSKKAAPRSSAARKTGASAPVKKVAAKRAPARKATSTKSTAIPATEPESEVAPMATTSETAFIALADALRVEREADEQHAANLKKANDELFRHTLKERGMAPDQIEAMIAGTTLASPTNGSTPTPATPADATVKVIDADGVEKMVTPDNYELIKTRVAMVIGDTGMVSIPGYDGNMIIEQSKFKTSMLPGGKPNGVRGFLHNLNPKNS